MKSTQQIPQFVSIIGNNARPVQLLHGWEFRKDNGELDTHNLTGVVPAR
jgi:hypothetical protein